MTKVSGFGYTVHVTDVDGNVRDIANDVTSWSIGRSGVTLRGVVNTAPGMSHSVFKDVTSSDVPRTVVIRHTRPEMPGFDGVVKFADYQVTREETGALVWTATPPGSDFERFMRAQIRDYMRAQGGGE